MDDLRACAEELGDCHDRVSALLSQPDPASLHGCTRLDWNVRELVLHVLLDAQRCLVTLSTPADRMPDTDRVRYWAGSAGRPSDGADAHRDWVRAVAAATSDDGLRALWRDTSGAAVHALRVAEPDVLATQGRSLTTADFADTLVVEAAVHLLDLEPAGTTAPPAALTRAARVVRALLPATPADWDDRAVVLRGTGREPLPGDASTPQDWSPLRW